MTTRSSASLSDSHPPHASKKSSLWMIGIICVIVSVVVGAGVMGKTLYQHFHPLTDYQGDGKDEIIIEINPGDTTQQIAETLQHNHVIATTAVFLEHARDNKGMAVIQPGFYQLRTEIPSIRAISALLDPHNRVGRVVIPEGRQLDDVYDRKTGTRTAGIFSLLAQASCIDLNHIHHCISADQFARAATDQSLSALSVPKWAQEPAQKLGHTHRRLEGLIGTGVWNINPQSSPTSILATLITQNTSHLDKMHFTHAAQDLHISPYELLIVASLVQRESLPADFSKVARVIYNRLAIDQRLEFDSTVNYPLDRQDVATSDTDRHTPTPWNTYATSGLPHTPICSPGIDAIEAAESPQPGDWLYFVTIDDQGTTLFTNDFQQHLANIQQAFRNGFFHDSP